MRLITRAQYDVLVDAPDDWETFSLARGNIQRRALQRLGLIEINGRQWKINVDGLEMIERCKRVWKLQLTLPLEETK